MNRWPALSVLLAFSLLGSCGGDGQTCTGAAACGGEISPGRYKISSYCATASGTIRSVGCPAGISITFDNFSVTGTVTFNADRTYQSMATINGSATETIPAECLMNRGVRLTCDQVTQSLEAQGMTGTCTGTGGCTCHVTLMGEPSMAAGSWSTSGTKLTMTPDGSDATTGDYCATPTQISYGTTTMGMPGMPDMPDVTGQTNMVLTKE